MSNARLEVGRIFGAKDRLAEYLATTMAQVTYGALSKTSFLGL